MLDLANPDAMFARTGAAGGEGAGNKTVIEGGVRGIRVWRV